MLILLFAVNAVISLMNAWVVGANWTESKIVGGWTRFLAWCGAIMAASGLTWCYMVLIGFAGQASGRLSHELVNAFFNAGYLLIIGPIVGSGFGIWVHSLVGVYKRRSFGNVAVAGWNTFAQAHNVYSLARNAPSALKEVSDFLTKGKKDTKWLFLMLIIITASSGILTTVAIMRAADRRHVSQLAGVRV